MNSKFILLVLCILFACSQALEYKRTSEKARNTFLYFSYGSNMNTTRMHKNNPSAKQIAIGKLKDYRLDFLGYRDTWHGCPATIVETKDAITWGVLWEISLQDLPNLDKQEGVDTGYYFGFNVTVETSNGELVECRTYQQVDTPNTNVPLSELPPERQPSPAYLNTIITGAHEYHLPSYYLAILKSVRHNNYYGPINIP